MDYVEALPLPSFWRLLRSLAKRPTASRIERWKAGLEGGEEQAASRTTCTPELAKLAQEFLGIGVGDG